MLSHRCKISLKSLDFSKLVFSVLLLMGMTICLSCAGTQTQVPVESRHAALTGTSFKTTSLDSIPNPAARQASSSECQTREIPTRSDFGTISGRWLATGSADPWLGKDKADHFMVSAFIAGTCYYWGRVDLRHSHTTAVIFSLSSTAGIGLAKEIYDGLSKRGTPSWKDLFADFLGIGVGILILSN